MKIVLPWVWLVVTAMPLTAQISLTANVGATSVDLSAPAVPRSFQGGHPALLHALSWDSLQPGLAVTEFTLDAGRLGMNVRVVVARIDPSRFDFQLVHATRSNRMTGAWNVDVAPERAALALNAGQFKETGPWGWLVLDGSERRDPGYGPLSAGIVFDSAGRVRWLPYAQLAGAARDRTIRYAFQSYPLLLFDAHVPALATGAALDQTHRDARLVLAQDESRQLLILLTRFDGLRGTVARIPIGLTVPESIALIGALGARHAVMLDGGISAQMLLRDRNGSEKIWKGLRDVPLALVAFPRTR